MTRGIWLAIWAAVGPLLGQDDPVEELALRVAAVRGGGFCVVDRGARDAVQIGDRVVLTPRSGPMLAGRVTDIDERSALVELIDPAAAIPVGTRGVVLMPKSRRAAVRPPAEPPVQEQAPGDPADDEWQPGMPLLGRTRPPRPSDRRSALRGRVFTNGNVVRTLGSFSQSYYNAGAALDINNVEGEGGIVRFFGEFNLSEETSGNSGADLRVYELSYERGGTRFEPWRLQAGRFLQRDMPEFGILDGIEVGYRREGGDRFGASLGYLPELDEDMESAADLQIAAWYVWNQDVAERLTLAIGYQKTWHRWERDRDLVVIKGRLLPASGWDLSGVVFCDFYGGNDNLKNQSFEITRANFFASRRWQGEGGIEFFYDHEEYPETLRRELPQIILPQTLIDAHVDRVSLHAWVYGSESTRWFTRLTGWVDEEAEGGATEFGVELTGMLRERSRTVLAGYWSKGLANEVAGVRIEHGGNYSYGRLDLIYELGYVTQSGFPSDLDNLLQHRLGGVLSTDLGAGWDASFFSDATIWDQEFSFGLGFFLQRHF